MVASPLGGTIEAPTADFIVDYVLMKKRVSDGYTGYALVSGHRKGTYDAVHLVESHNTIQLEVILLQVWTKWLAGAVIGHICGSLAIGMHPGV